MGNHRESLVTKTRYKLDLCTMSTEQVRLHPIQTHLGNKKTLHIKTTGFVAFSASTKNRKNFRLSSGSSQMLRNCLRRKVKELLQRYKKQKA